MINILSGVTDLENISLGVAVSVIALLAITYVLLFFVWHKYYEKCINHGLEDLSLKKDIMVEYKKFLKPIPLKKIENDTVLEKKDNLDSKYNFETVTKEVRFKKKKQDMSVNVILALLYIILIFIFAGGMYSRLSTGTTNYFGNSYLVIKTGSMETVDNTNDYIYDYNLNDQITQYSLIQMDEVKEEEMRLYDIYAFYGNDNEIIVHRLIAINQGENGLTYTFRGDANPASAPYERNISFDRIIARYNGHSNYIFGVVTLYLSSNIGLITIFFAFSTALFFDLFEARSNKIATRRKLVILKEIFKDNPVVVDEPAELPYLEANLRGFKKKLILHIDVIDKRTYIEKLDTVKSINYDTEKSVKQDTEIIQDILEKTVVPNNLETNDVYTYKTYSKRLKKKLIIHVTAIDKRSKVKTDDNNDVGLDLDSVNNELPPDIKKYDVVNYDNRPIDGKYSAHINSYDNNVEVQIKVDDKRVK